ncbi:MAG TPA: HEAT repeat domain-containing protein [Polyangiales bacterium]|nr:HEAT repeat domain-containing protein [Polyangiales bacterium]
MQTHPELRDRALAGTLHRLDDGRELAIPYVYHDPEARKFALVLPAVLAHTELSERARLLGDLARDTPYPIPAYVRETTVVIGQANLAMYVGEPLVEEESEETVDSDGVTSVEVAELSAREQSLGVREHELAEQEMSLVRMSEALSSREQELTRLNEQLAIARRGVELREQALAGRGRFSQHDVANSREDVSHTHELAVAAGMHGRTHPPPLPGSYRRTGPPPLPMRTTTLPPIAAQRESRSHAQHTPPPLPHQGHTHVQSAREPEVAPPAYFTGQRTGQLAVRLVADELWLFVHVDEADAEQMRHGLELFLQYVEIEGYPVLLLSLLAHAPESRPMRLALDGHSDADQRVLEHLSRSFRARVALYVRRRYSDTLTVAALREGVAQAISDRMQELPSELPAIGATDALLRVQHAPPPLTNDDLPFGSARREASTTASVRASVAQLAAWLVPEKLREATLIYCTPRNVIEATMRRVLRAAVAFGVVLPDPLIERAVEQHVARDAPSLLRAQLESFRRRVVQGVNDLGQEATRKNWERLFAQAETHGVEVDAALRELSQARGSTPEGGGADTAHSGRSVHELTYNELLAGLEHAEERVAIIEELCLRGQAHSLSSVLAVLPKLEREQLPAAMAHLLLLGELAGDGLIGMLSAGDPNLRQLTALALGKLRLKRALPPLIALLQTDDSGIYTEVARALGDYGSAAARPLAEAAISGPHPDRLAVALAHVANRGGAQAVEKLENAPEPTVAHVARRAMASRSRIEWEDLAVRQQRTLEEAGAATLLSQAFYAAVPKVAI